MAKVTRAEADRFRREWGAACDAKQAARACGDRDAENAAEARMDRLFKESKRRHGGQ